MFPLISLFLLLAGGWRSAAAYDWAWASPLPQGFTLNAVTWSGSRFLAVGKHGAIVASPTGEAWTSYPSGTEADLKAVAANGSGFVAVGDSGIILSSSDGTRWTRRSAGVDAYLFGVGWDGGKWIAVGGMRGANESVILYSPDGAQWTPDASNRIAYSLRGVFRVNGQTILAGDFASFAYAPDSSRWRLWEAGYFASLAWGGDRYFAISSSAYATSTDGKAWNRGSLVGSAYYRAVAWDGKQAIAVGTRNGLRTSTDGETWTFRRLAEPETDWNGIASDGNGRTVAVGENGALLLSTDGTAWQRRDISLTRATLQDVASGGGAVVAVGDSCVMLTSRNGKDWPRPSSVPVNPYISNGLTSVAASGTGYAATGNIYDTSLFLASSDAASWESRMSKSGPFLTRLYWTGKLYLGLGEGAIWSSPDGLAWSERFRGPAGFRGFASDGSRIIALGDKSVAISTDGLAWSLRDLPDSIRVSSLVWAGSRYVAVSWEGTVLTSQDGVEWKPATVPWEGISLQEVAWTGTEVVAVGYGVEGGVVATSRDGLQWDSLAYVSQRMLNAVAWTGRYLVLAGDGGTLLVGSLDGTKIRIEDAVRTPGPVLRADWSGRSIRVRGRDLSPGSLYSIRLLGLDGKAKLSWMATAEAGRLSLQMPATLHAAAGSVLEIAGEGKRMRTRIEAAP